ncbi:MAG: MATE family efflux transporter [Eubacterium sp.]|nr:MATE family efflux transporter [Eubacterium sp.]
MSSKASSASAKKTGKNEVDMIHGPLMGKILLFALPIAAASILQQLFNSADSAVIGQFSSPEALAAVGLNAEPIGIILGLITGLAVGVNVLIARFIGMNRRDAISPAIHTSMLFSLIAGLILTVGGLAAARPLLVLIATPENILGLATRYLEIYVLGTPFIVIYNFGSAILRAKGDTRRPLYALIASGILNVVLNLFFVIVCRLNVTGVALATDISNGISAALVVVFLMRETGEFHLSLKKLRIGGADLKFLLAVGMPAGIQEAVFCVSNVFIQAAINRFGSDAIAGSAAALNFEYFGYFAVAAFSQAATTFVSQNHAAGEEKRCRTITLYCMLFGILTGAMLSVPAALSGTFFMRIFSSKEAVLLYAVRRNHLVLLWESLVTLYEVPAAVLRGRGHSLLPSVEILCGTIVFRLIWLFTVFMQHPSFEMLCLVWPVSWLITALALYLSILILKKRKIY